MFYFVRGFDARRQPPNVGSEIAVGVESAALWSSEVISHCSALPAMSRRRWLAEQKRSCLDQCPDVIQTL